jgi:hypothetical protein
MQYAVKMQTESAKFTQYYKNSRFVHDHPLLRFVVTVSRNARENKIFVLTSATNYVLNILSLFIDLNR